MNEDLIARLLAAANKEANELADLLNEAADALEAAQPVGEPVAWMDNDGNFSDHNEYKTHNIPLYTHPAPQVPMTDEEIDPIWDSFDVAPIWSYRYLFTRAIEAHHNIGVKP